MADEAIIKEVQIRDERKYNAILFNVKELQTNLKEERKQYDRNSVNDILDICDDTLGHDSFANLIRLGKKQEGKARPIKITFNTMDFKRQFFRNLGNLSSEVNVDYKDASIQHDLTALEREQ